MTKEEDIMMTLTIQEGTHQERDMEKRDTEKIAPVPEIEEIKEIRIEDLTSETRGEIAEWKKPEIETKDKEEENMDTATEDNTMENIEIEDIMMENEEKEVDKEIVNTERVVEDMMLHLNIHHLM